jgi:hypothetical protein
MSAATIIAGLQTMHAGITGIKSAPTKRPASINTAELPMALVRPGACEWSIAALGQWTATRAYEVVVYVGPVAQGQGIDEVWQKALVLLDLFGLAYTASTLPGTLGANVRSVVATSDTGLTGDVMFAGVAYQGFVFTVTVKEKAA